MDKERPTIEPSSESEPVIQVDSSSKSPFIKKYWWVASALVLILVAGGIAVATRQKNQSSVQNELSESVVTSATLRPSQSALASPSSETLPSTQLIWQQRDGDWQATSTPPTCEETLTLAPPTDLSKATSILYPGQTRGGNYKPHGGFRFDQSSNRSISVTAPIDGFIVRGGHYRAEGEIQYTFDVMNNCGVLYRVGHLRELPEEMMALTLAWPEAKEGDSRTQSISPPVFLKQGKTLGTAVGIIKDKNTFFDFGVYDYRTTNAASASSSYKTVHAQDKELSWHAICWFDWLSANDEAIVRGLPPGDPTSGKKSDYCM